MCERTYQQGHAFCAACKSTFPSSWFRSKDAVRGKDGRDFCSKKCADGFTTETSALRLLSQAFGNLSGVD